VSEDLFSCTSAKGIEKALMFFRSASGGISWGHLLLNLPPHPAVGDVEVVTRLEIQPEPRRHAEVAGQTHGCICRDCASSEHDIIGPRARYLDRIGERVNADTHGDQELVPQTVRRQINWDWVRFELREYLAHLVVDVRRRICCVASAFCRMSFV